MNDNRQMSADEYLDEMVLKVIADRGGLKVARGKCFESNLGRVVAIEGVNRRRIHQSVLRLVRAGRITCRYTQDLGGHRATRYVHYDPVTIPEAVVS